MSATQVWLSIALYHIDQGDLAHAEVAIAAYVDQVLRDLTGQKELAA